MGPGFERGCVAWPDPLQLVSPGAFAGTVKADLGGGEYLFAHVISSVPLGQSLYNKKAMARGLNSNGAMHASLHCINQTTYAFFSEKVSIDSLRRALS